MKQKTRKRRRLLLGILIDHRGKWSVRGEYADSFFTSESVDESFLNVFSNLKAAEESGEAVRELLNVSKIKR